MMIFAESCFRFCYLLSLIVGHNFIISLWANTFTNLCVQQWFYFVPSVCAGNKNAERLSVEIEMVHKRKMSSVD